MRKLLFASLTLLFVCAASMAQQTPAPQPLTFYYDYQVNPGKEDEFMTLVRTVGAPVRDKLLAEGVILAWGIETPVLRYPGGTTHLIWFAVANFEGLEKVLKGMEAQQAKLAADEAKGPKMKTTAERIRETINMSKTRDWLVRDLVSNYGNPPASAVLPTVRYSFVKVKEGKGAEYRRTWEKYNKPVLDKLVSDNVVLAYGLAVEELKTDGEFTHFSWVATADMAGMDKITSAFAADRARRTEDERSQITAAFTSTLEPDKSRGMMTRSMIFKMSAPK